MAALRRLLRALRAQQQLCPPAHTRLFSVHSPGSSSSSRSSLLLLVSGAAGAGLALACYAIYRDGRVQNWGERLYRDKGLKSGEIMPGLRGAGILVPVSAAKETSSAEKNEFEDLDMFASSREQRFRVFASLEFEGQLYMTPRDFLESVTTDEPRNSKKWKSLSRQDLSQLLIDTPPVWKGSSRFFRTLGDKGDSSSQLYSQATTRLYVIRHLTVNFPASFVDLISFYNDTIVLIHLSAAHVQYTWGDVLPGSMISYTEYLFLLCILTKPHAGFKIAFNMFDTDGNQMVDREEFLVLQEIFRKKNEKKERKGEEEKCAQLVHKADAQDQISRSYWDTLRRGTSQALFSDLAEGADELTSSMIHTTLLVHFFGKKGKIELNFEDFYRFMDNLQTEVLEIEFLSYSKGMNTISEEDFAHILLRYTNVENTSSYLENVRFRIPEEKGISFDEFRSFFQFLNNLEDFAIAMQMYNFASRSIGQDEFKRAVYVATGLKLSPHLVNTVFKIFDVDRDDQLSYKEFIGIMKDRLHRGFRGYKTVQKYTTFKACLKKQLNNR